MDYSFKEFEDTNPHRFSCQSVFIGNDPIGTVWRERVNVVVSKLTEPRKMAVKWRWFALETGGNQPLGRGTRSAMLLGAGFQTKSDALDAMRMAHQPSQSVAEQKETPRTRPTC